MENREELGGRETDSAVDSEENQDKKVDDSKMWVSFVILPDFSNMQIVDWPHLLYTYVMWREKLPVHVLKTIIVIILTSSDNTMAKLIG